MVSIVLFFRTRFNTLFPKSKVKKSLNGTSDHIVSPLLMFCNAPFESLINRKHKSDKEYEKP